MKHQYLGLCSTDDDYNLGFRNSRKLQVLTYRSALSWHLLAKQKALVFSISARANLKLQLLGQDTDPSGVIVMRKFYRRNRDSIFPNFLGLWQIESTSGWLDNEEGEFLYSFLEEKFYLVPDETSISWSVFNRWRLQFGVPKLQKAASSYVSQCIELTSSGRTKSVWSWWCEGVKDIIISYFPTCGNFYIFK